MHTALQSFLVAGGPSLLRWHAGLLGKVYACVPARACSLSASFSAAAVITADIATKPPARQHLHRLHSSLSAAVCSPYCPSRSVSLVWHVRLRSSRQWPSSLVYLQMHHRLLQLASRQHIIWCAVHASDVNLPVQGSAPHQDRLRSTDLHQSHSRWLHRAVTGKLLLVKT